jgi:hypothetical protein
MYLTKEQLEDAGIDPEKIQKFAALFPYGTEMTRELCMKHPDVFSFGLPGARLMPHAGWKAYWDKVLEAKFEYKMRLQIPMSNLRWNMRDVEKEKIGFARTLARWKEENPNYNCDDAPRLFTFGPPMPLGPPPSKSRQQALDEYKIVEERITREYNSEIALIFHETFMVRNYITPCKQRYPKVIWS